MTTPFVDHLDADARLVMLRLLDQAGPTLNDSVLHEGLRRFGHTKLTRQDVRKHLDFLASRGGLTYEVNDVGTWVATITDHGRKVARGTARMEGVARPGQE